MANGGSPRLMAIDDPICTTSLISGCDLDPVPLSTSRSFTLKFSSTIRLLQLCGYYPMEFHTDHRVAPKMISFDRGTRLWGYRWALLWLFFVLLNLGVCGAVGQSVRYYINEYGPWYPETMMAIAVGMKPFQVVILLLIFNHHRHNHTELLNKLDSVFSAYERQFNVMPSVSRVNKIIMVLGVGSGLFTLAIRISETLLFDIYVTGNETVDPFSFEKLVFEYPSYFIVPMHTVWQVVPIVYFVQLNHLIRHWLNGIKGAIARDDHLQACSMTVYFDEFRLLTQLQQQCGRVFNKYILFSLALCVMTLCLTIYFFSQTADMNAEFPTHPADMVVFYANLAYSCSQVVLLLSHLVILSSEGFITNEESRAFLHNAISVHANTSQDRYQIFRLSELIHCQHNWGISVWRGFLVERSLLPTIGGLIITYAIFLIRLKPPSHRSCNEEIKNVFGKILNMTNLTLTHFEL